MVGYSVTSNLRNIFETLMKKLECNYETPSKRAPIAAHKLPAAPARKNNAKYEHMPWCYAYNMVIAKIVRKYVTRVGIKLTRRGVGIPWVYIIFVRIIRGPFQTATFHSVVN